MAPAPKRKPGRPAIEPTKLVGVRLPLDIVDELTRIAVERRSTVSTEARRILMDYFEGNLD